MIKSAEVKSSVHPVRLAAGLAILVTVLTGLFSGCDPVEISDPGQTTDSTAATGKATLTLSNFKAQEPGTLTFLLFPESAMDFTNANGGMEIGALEYGATKAFQVPAGRWKLAYQDEVGGYHGMVDEASPDLTWLLSVFAKDSSYSVILETDGNQTVWVMNYETDPPVKPQ